MYDIRPLEEEWKRYRKKRQKPWYIGGFIFLIFSLLGIGFFGNVKINLETFTSYFKTIKNNTLPTFKEVKSNVLLDDALEVLDTEEHGTIVTIEESVVEKKVEKLTNILVDIPLLEDVKEPAKMMLSEDKDKKIHIEIVETNSVTAYKDVEKRFRQSHDIDDSLFLARSYYKKGYYKKAQYWALETNKIDENIEDGVLIFVKSKAKLGKKNEAVSILTNYISKTSSQQAKNLLSKIKNDKL